MRPSDSPATSPAADAFELRDLSKRFGPQWVLARINYRLQAGRSLLLTGHNGSGKTTLLRLIATATAPTTGALSVCGFDARQDRHQVRGVTALLSHASYLYEDLTAAQNLLLFARLLGLPDARERVRQTLERVGLQARASSPVRQFSAGMRKRLAIGRLLLKAPKLALLDEPFGELDPAGIAAMEQIIGELKRSGTSIVLATHLIEQGQALTDERLHLENGRVAEAA